MLIDLYIIFQITAIILFFISFFTKQEILWALTLVLTGTLMFTSWNVEYYTYVFNATISAYDMVIINNSYPYLVAINFLFFALSMLLGLFDLFDKYGFSFLNKKTNSR